MKIPSFGQAFCDLFRSLPEEKTATFPGHVQEYLGTTSGSQACFDLIARVFETIKMTTPSAEWVCCSTKVQEVFDTSALALDLPDLVSSPCKFMSNCVALVSPSSTEARSLLRRTKDVAYTGLGAIRSGTRAVLFASSTSCAAIPVRQLVSATLVGTVTTLCLDTADLLRDCLVLGEEGHSGETALLALVNVIKNIASVVAGVFVWISLSLPQVSIAPWLPALILGSGLIFSVARISSYFVEKMMVEPSLNAS